MTRREWLLWELGALRKLVRAGQSRLEELGGGIPCRSSIAAQGRTAQLEAMASAVRRELAGLDCTWSDDDCEDDCDDERKSRATSAGLAKKK